MNSQERFHRTMEYGLPDRVPYFEEGIRDDVLEVWDQRGLKTREDFEVFFLNDEREDIYLDLDLQPRLKNWPSTSAELKNFSKHLDPEDPTRLPDGWEEDIQKWKDRKHVLMMRVHRGLFESLGIGDWRRFEDVMFSMSDRPEFVRQYMQIYGDFAARLVERALDDVEIDAAIFSEPIGGNHGALISPDMYEKFALESYLPLLSVLKERGVRWIILRTYANARALIPVMMAYGFNCLWACEVNPGVMDYRSLRGEFGKELRLIGGIDLDALRGGKRAIRFEIEEKVPPLIAAGGYIPLADGRIRADIPFENYVYYRRLIQELTQLK